MIRLRLSEGFIPLNNRSEMRQARAISSSSSSSVIACRDKIMFSRQNYVCHEKWLPWQMFCRDKKKKKKKNRDNFPPPRDNTFVTTSILLSRQNTCFVATKLLLRQKWYLWQLLPMIRHNVVENTLAGRKKKKKKKCPCSYSYSLSVFLCRPRPLGFLPSKGGRS